MTFQPNPDARTDDWGNKVHQHEPPDWSDPTIPPFAERGRRWSQNPADRPWFDQPDALDRVEAMSRDGLLSAEERSMLVQWVVDGYFVIENALSPDQDGLMDRYNRDLDEVWTEETPRPGLQVSGVRRNGRRLNPVPHAELLSWPMDERLKLRDTQVWRIHYFQPFTQAGLDISKSASFLRMTSLILHGDPQLLNLTAYKYSSEVAIHQDLWFYHLHPMNHLVGIWFACEDVHPDTGPLIIYPGSHRHPPFPGFSNYPQTNYRTSDKNRYDAIARYLTESVDGIAPVEMPVKRGTAIFLQGLLTHTSARVTQRESRSRRSMVLHYSLRGMNQIDQVEGPFNY